MKRIIVPAIFLAACSQQAAKDEVANAPETNLPATNTQAPEAPLNPPAPG